MLQSSILVTIITLLGSTLGFCVQLLMARSYGAGVEVDAYLFAISAPTFIAGMVASLLSYAVIPKMAQTNENSEVQSRLIVSLLAMILSLAIGLIVLSPMLQMFQQKLIPESSAIFRLSNIDKLLLVGWAIAAAQILLAALCVILMGLKQAIAAASLNLGAYFGMLVSLVFFENDSINKLALGMLTGTCVSVMVALYLLRARVFSNWHKFAWSEIHILVVNSPYTIIAMSCFSVYAVVDSYWGPRAGDGVLSSLGYSQRIIIALGNLAVAGPSAVLVPRFAELIAAKNLEGFVRVLMQSLGVTFIVCLMLATGLFFGGDYLISLMFTNAAFQNDVSMNVAKILRFCLPGMVFMLASSIALRALYCFAGTEKLSAYLGAGWGLLYFSISGAMVSSGGVGLAISYSATWVVYFIFLIYFIFQEVRKMSKVNGFAYE